MPHRPPHLHTALHQRKLTNNAVLLAAARLKQNRCQKGNQGRHTVHANSQEKANRVGVLGVRLTVVHLRLGSFEPAALQARKAYSMSVKNSTYQYAATCKDSAHACSRQLVVHASQHILILLRPRVMPPQNPCLQDTPESSQAPDGPPPCTLQHQMSSWPATAARRAPGSA